MYSSAKRMWQKCFLLFRRALISPHCSKISTMVSSVLFSGSPPTNTVLHPGGLSLVVGGRRSKRNKKSDPEACPSKRHLALICNLTRSALHSYWSVRRLAQFYPARQGELIQYVLLAFKYQKPRSFQHGIIPKALNIYISFVHMMTVHLWIITKSKLHGQLWLPNPGSHHQHPQPLHHSYSFPWCEEGFMQTHILY